MEFEVSTKLQLFQESQLLQIDVAGDAGILAIAQSHRCKSGIARLTPGDACIPTRSLTLPSHPYRESGRACSCYVNQVLVETKEGLGLDKDSEPMRDEKGVIGHIGHRERTLPLDYLRRILKVFNCKAVVTRPLLETEWRPAK